MPEHDYLVHVSPTDLRPKGLLWPIRRRDRLPVVGIPLSSEDAPAPLDLQTVLTVAYDRAGYDLEIDYTRTPVPPLSDTDTAWASTLLSQGER